MNDSTTPPQPEDRSKRRIAIAGIIAAIIAALALGASAMLLTTSHTTVVRPAAITAPAVTPRHHHHHHHGTPPVVVVPAAPAQAVPAVPAWQYDAKSVVDSFYTDINNQDYSGAWALGGDNIGGSDYSGWAAGYATTSYVSLSDWSYPGSGQVQASLAATQTDGSVKTYTGTYGVSNGVIVSANIVQTS